MGNPGVSLLVPAALLADPRPMGEGRHVAFSLAAGGARSRCVRFGDGSALPAEPGEPVDAAVRLEVNRYNGATEPRLILRASRCCARADRRDRRAGRGKPALRRSSTADLSAGTGGETRPGELVAGGRSPEATPGRVLDAGDRCRAARDARGSGVAGLIGDLVAQGTTSSSWPPTRRTAHGRSRAASAASRSPPGTPSHDDPGLAAPFAHVVALDPPTRPGLEHLPGQGWTHLAWGEPELGFATRIHEWDYALRTPLAAVYRALREAGGVEGEACEAMLSGDGAQPRSAALAGRLVRVLAELGLVILEREAPALTVAESPERTALERSAAFRAYQQTLEDGLRFLASSTQRAAA